MIRTGNIANGVPEGAMPDERTDVLAARGDFRIERIVSTGQVTPEGQWFDQETDEWVLVLAGAARLGIEGEDQERELAEGDWILLPARCRHRVSWTQSEPPTIWLAVHFRSEDRCMSE
jgi:cupin 2 domain-containing protein